MDAGILARDLVHARMDGDVIDRNHADYDRSRRVWNAMADRRPAVIARARNAADVEKVVTVAAKHGALLAIRGGGHSIPGLSTCNDGIVLDLSLMNAVNIDGRDGHAQAQGGALLGDLDRAGMQAGLVVPAGSSPIPALPD
jgi:FAD/FMN-containing dehydrogenase